MTVAYNSTSAAAILDSIKSQWELQKVKPDSYHTKSKLDHRCTGQIQWNSHLQCNTNKTACQRRRPPTNVFN